MSKSWKETRRSKLVLAEERPAESESTRDADLAKLVNAAAQLERIEAETRTTMAPAGTLGLHPLVDARRLEYLIPDAAFTHVAMFDRIVVVQVPEREGDTYLKDGVIVKSQRTMDKERKEAPRGIIISAGLQAQDQLVSNGCGLGHIVRFIRNAPYRFLVDQVAGIDFNIMLLRAGDVVSSEDLHEAIKSGKARVEVKSTTVDGVIVRSHLYVDEAGQTWAPESPWISDDT